MSTVGAIWIPSLEDCKRYGGFEVAVFFCVSECGKYCAGANVGVITRPDIGDSMPAQYTVFMQKTIEPEQWNIMRIAVLDGKLGKPLYGTSPFNTKRVSENHCTCGTTVFMNKGCVSNRGLSCPKTPDPPISY